MIINETYEAMQPPVPAATLSKELLIQDDSKWVES